MSTSNRILRQIIGRFAPAAAAAKLRALAATIDQASALTRTERKTLLSTCDYVPDALVARIARLAEDEGGDVLGITFDSIAARRTLEYARACRPVVVAARALAQLLADDVLRRRAHLANRSLAVYGAMGRLVRTPEGKRLVTEYETMQDIVRAHNRPARPRRAVAPLAPRRDSSNAVAATAEASSAAAE